MGRATNKLLRAFLAVCVTVGLMPAPAFADERIAAGSSPELATQVAGTVLADTNNAWKHDYALWSSPQTSYLHVNAAGKLERVEYSATDELFVEELASDCMSAVSRKVIERSAYSPSTMPPAGKPLWGGFFSGADANYVVTGLENPNGIDIVATFRITKFDKSWNYLSCAELFGANTTKPFAAGGCSFAEAGGQLYVRTCHEMYDSGDGVNHQANMTVIVDEATMDVVKSYELKSSINNYAGYVSHSFNQFVVANGGAVYGVDHGDAYPRGIVVKKFGDTYASAFELKGAVGRNATGASLGGARASATTGKVLIVGSAVNQDAFVSQGCSEDGLARNVWITTVDSQLGTTQRSLTAYADGSADGASTPFIVKVNDNRFLVMWDKKSNGAHASHVSYQFVNGDGEAIGPTQSAPAALSDCQPVLHDGKVVWYAGSSGMPVVYSIDSASGAFDMAANLSGATIVCPAISSRAYNANTKQYVDNAVAYYRIADDPDVSVVLGGQALKEGDDYELSYDLRGDTLTGTVTAIGKGRYVGQSVKRDFNILPQHAGTFTVDDIEPVSYTGERVEPEIVVHDGVGRKLTRGTDYDLVWSTDGISAIVQNVRVVGKGFYYSDTLVHYSVDETSIEGAALTLSQTSYVFNKEKFEPEVTVSFNGKTLAVVDDYLVGYDNNYAAGTATVTVTGIKGYIGKATAEFTIEKRDLSDAVVEFDSWNNKGTVSSVVLDGQKLWKDQDYALAYDPESDGTYSRAIVTGIGNYTGQAIAVYGGSRESLSGAVVELEQREYEYTGQPIFVNPKVTLGGKLLTKGADYAVDYKDNNRFPGEMTVIVSGINGYEGSVEAECLIYLGVDESNSSAWLVSPYATYTGSAITPEPTVKANGWELAEGIDYTVSYEDNVNAGQAAAVVHFTGGYRGADRVVGFTIEPRDIRSASTTVTPKKKAYAYTGKAIVPKATVDIGGTELVEGRDYTVSCKDNVNPGDATLTVSGTGNYTGSIDASFTITVKPVPLTIWISPITVKVKQNPFKVKRAKVKTAKCKLKKSRVFSVSNAVGKVTFAKKSGDGKLSVSKSGTVTVKKGAKKGVHKMKVVVRAAGDERYEPDSQTVTVRVKVV